MDHQGWKIEMIDSASKSKSSMDLGSFYATHAGQPCACFEIPPPKQLQKISADSILQKATSRFEFIPSQSQYRNSLCAVANLTVMCPGT
jgi:hypothetical protein